MQGTFSIKLPITEEDLGSEEKTKKVRVSQLVFLKGLTKAAKAHYWRPSLLINIP